MESKTAAQHFESCSVGGSMAIDSVQRDPIAQQRGGPGNCTVGDKQLQQGLGTGASS